MVHSSLLLSLVLLSPVFAAEYDMVKYYEGSSFFNGWDFFTGGTFPQ